MVENKKVSFHDPKKISLLFLWLQNHNYWEFHYMDVKITEFLTVWFNEIFDKVYICAPQFHSNFWQDFAAHRVIDGALACCDKSCSGCVFWTSTASVPRLRPLPLPTTTASLLPSGFFSPRSQYVVIRPFPCNTIDRACNTLHYREHAWKYSTY